MTATNRRSSISAATTWRVTNARAVVFGELPKTSTGKVQKFVLRDRARALSLGRGGQSEGLRPRRGGAGLSQPSLGLAAHGAQA